MTSQFVLGKWDYHKDKTSGPRVETVVGRPPYGSESQSWSVFCREGGRGRKSSERFDEMSSASSDKIRLCVIFKDLGPRLPFEIGGVWTGDLSSCDWTLVKSC